MKQSALLRLLQYARPYHCQIALASFYSVVNKLFDIAPEILIGIAIDVVVSKDASFLARLGFVDPWQQILILGGLTLAIWVGESLFEYLYLLKWRGLAQNLQHDLRRDTYSHIQNLDLSYFEDQKTGNLVSIINDDTNQLENFLNGGANSLIQTLTAVVGVGAVFFFLSPLIALFAFLPIPLVIFGAFYFQKKAKPLYANVRSRVGDLSARLSNNISGILTIKSYVREAHESELLNKDSQEYLKANKKAIAVSSAFIPIIRMAILSGFLATFLLGAHLVLENKLAVGSYGVLVFLTQRLLWPLTSLAATVDLYERAMASANRILNILRTPIEILSGPESPDEIAGEIEFKDLVFSYNNGPKVLDKISVAIPSKKTTAFVGPTGSGKSTLVKLLCRFYEPTSGELNLDSIPLFQYDLKAIRSRISLVTQDVFLFHGTVKENILYGRPNATDEDVFKAAKASEAHDFILELPNGYDTLVGERGQKLSGGQKQRISIARAVLKNPDILILDEATSAVDNETEAAIQRSMDIISEGRTTIVIAHRLSTVVNADQIVVLDQGRIVATGTHSQLLEQRGLYHQLWTVQTGHQKPASLL